VLFAQTGYDFQHHVASALNRTFIVLFEQDGTYPYQDDLSLKRRPKQMDHPARLSERHEQKSTFIAVMTP
jgi:hypothetical protein